MDVCVAAPFDYHPVIFTTVSARASRPHVRECKRWVGSAMNAVYWCNKCDFAAIRQVTRIQSKARVGMVRSPRAGRPHHSAGRRRHYHDNSRRRVRVRFTARWCKSIRRIIPSLTTDRHSVSGNKSRRSVASSPRRNFCSAYFGRRD